MILKEGDILNYQGFKLKVETINSKGETLLKEVDGDLEMIVVGDEAKTLVNFIVK